jgi:hypothetical protein
MKTTSASATAGAKLGGKGKATGFDVRFDQRLEARLEDRNDALFQRLDLFGSLVDADHVMSEIRKAGSRHEADITRSNHHNTHQ